MAEVRLLHEQAPKSATGYMLEGDVLAAQKRLPPAEGAYREALKLAPAEPRAAIGLHRTLVAEGKTAEADAFAGKWTAANPKDAVMLIYLAERDLSAGDLKAAAVRFRAAVDRQPDNALTLNNLAWVAGELGDPAALGYAERALALAPKQPALLDTYGTLLIAQGKVDKGLESLRRASELDPDNYGVRRLKYARQLLRAGQKEAAQKELRALLDSPGDFKGKNEIGQLLGTR
jgi:predicted Zn-dependent protease